MTPAPVPTPDTEAFWAAAAQGRLMLPRCASCGRAHWYPRTLCPFCFGDDLAWTEASGRGTIYSVSVVRRTAQPYAVAYVTLAEGPSMLTNIVDAPLDALAIGQAVRLVFTPSGTTRLPCFTPCDMPDLA